MSKRLFTFVLSLLLIACFLPVPVIAQDQGEEPVIELLQPNYMNSDYGFGMVVPADYTTSGHDEGETWVLEIMPSFPDLANARLSIEDLPDNITDVAGFWQIVKDRDPMMEHNTTYEMVTSVADTGAILARIENMENGQYLLVILWVWVHDGHGYTLSGYPPQGGDNDLARDIAKNLVVQFRWMTSEEIEAAESVPLPAPPEPSIGPGVEF
jgi:hypothetical protein